MRFHFTADITFDADNLDHASELLRDHFALLGDEDGATDDPLWTANMLGNMDLRRVESATLEDGAEIQDSVSTKTRSSL